MASRHVHPLSSDSPAPGFLNLPSRRRAVHHMVFPALQHQDRLATPQIAAFALRPPRSKAYDDGDFRTRREYCRNAAAHGMSHKRYRKRPCFGLDRVQRRLHAGHRTAGDSIPAANLVAGPKNGQIEAPAGRFQSRGGSPKRRHESTQTGPARIPGPWLVKRLFGTTVQQHNNGGWCRPLPAEDSLETAAPHRLHGIKLHASVQQP
jgi:hypothetical protein